MYRKIGSEKFAGFRGSEKFAGFRGGLLVCVEVKFSRGVWILKKEKPTFGIGRYEFSILIKLNWVSTNCSIYNGIYTIQ